jgi:hypothetical protein
LEGRTPQPERRDNTQLTEVARDVNELAKDMKELAAGVRVLREWLISSPDESPLGRALLKLAQENRSLIVRHRDDFEKHVRDAGIDHDKDIEDWNREWDKWKKEEFNPIQTWRNQLQGSYRTLQATQVILGILSLAFILREFFVK